MYHSIQLTHIYIHSIFFSIYSVLFFSDLFYFIPSWSFQLYYSAFLSNNLFYFILIYLTSPISSILWNNTSNYIILYYIILNYIISYHIELYYIILYSIIIYHIIQYYMYNLVITKMEKMEKRIIQRARKIILSIIIIKNKKFTIFDIKYLVIIIIKIAYLFFFLSILKAIHHQKVFFSK